MGWRLLAIVLLLVLVWQLYDTWLRCPVSDLEWLFWLTLEKWRCWLVY